MTRSETSVVVLAGGLSHERDVSLRSGRRVAEALRAAGVDVSVSDIDAGLLPTLAADPPGVVVPLLHGASGEDGALRDVLGMLGLPYVGSGPQACRVAFDKPTAKSAVAEAGLSTPASVTLPQTTFRELGAAAVMTALLDTLGLPLMVKPARGGSSLGAAVVRTPDELPAAMVGCFSYGDTALVERFVSGVEVAVSVVETDGGPAALPVVEIVPDGGFYDYSARYTAGATEFFAPARLDPAVAARCAAAAVTAHRALRLRDLSRTDLVVDDAGVPWFLEVNVAPGMTETSLFPQAAAAGGQDLGTLWRGLVERASARGHR
ncbi:MAG TPA: D-alanine--D-alanine ligase [Actinomycetes bacterium]